MDKPDFEALRAERNAAMERFLRELCEEKGWDPEKVAAPFHRDDCYCNCPVGPCEHDFQGWREFEDGRGGEQVCRRCGLGAMGHAMRVGP